MKFLTVSAVAALTLALTSGAALADTSITVSPSEVRPGSPIVLKSSCKGDAERLEYTSPAFTDTAVADSADTEDATRVVLKSKLTPGSYQIRGECKGGGSNEVMHTDITVVEDGSHAAPTDASDAAPAFTPVPTGAPQSGGGGIYQPSDPTVPLATLAIGLLVVAGVGLIAYRRAMRHGG